MTQRANILQELNEIGSTFINMPMENIFSVPSGYFENFAEQMLIRIKTSDTKDELNDLSTLLNSISKENPYSIPPNYFDGLEEKLMQHVRESADYQTVQEELESISPLLSQLSKQTVYSVPKGYFENIYPAEKAKQEIKIISITHHRWFRYAAAAVVVGFIALGGFLFINKKPSIDPNKDPQGWVAKNVVKKVNPAQLDEFIKLADEENNTKSTVITNKTDKSDDIKELMKDVPDTEIKNFLNETSVLNDNSAMN